MLFLLPIDTWSELGGLVFCEVVEFQLTVVSHTTVVSAVDAVTSEVVGDMIIWVVRLDVSELERPSSTANTAAVDVPSTSATDALVISVIVPKFEQRLLIGNNNNRLNDYLYVNNLVSINIIICSYNIS